jgi:hypothetical protein
MSTYLAYGRCAQVPDHIFRDAIGASKVIALFSGRVLSK